MSKYDQKSEKPVALLLRPEPRLHVVHFVHPVHTLSPELARRRALYGLVRPTTAMCGKKHRWLPCMSLPLCLPAARFVTPITA